MRDFNWLIKEMNFAEPEKLSKLRCPHYGLASLKGIENFSNLEYLNCSNNYFKNFKGINNLPKLKILIANDNFLTDLSDLKGSNIEHLEVADNKLLSLNGIEEMDKLEKIVITGNNFDKKIIDITKDHNGIKKLKQFLKENPIYTSSKVSKLIKTGIFENLLTFEKFTK